MKRNQMKKLTAILGAVALSLTAVAFAETGTVRGHAENESLCLIGDGTSLSFAASGMDKIAGNPCNTGAVDPKYKWFEGKDQTVSDLPDGYLYGVVEESALPEGGEDAGVKLYIHSWDTELLRLNFGQTISVSEVDGLSIKAYFNIAQTTAQGTLYLASEDSTGEAGDCVAFDLSSIAQNAWVDLFLSEEDLAVLANENGKISSLVFAYATTGGENLSPYGCAYIDEIALAERFTVKYLCGNGQNEATMYAFKGETIAYPEIPERAGFVFGGWYDGETLFDFSAPIKGDKTLTAKWYESSSDSVVGAYTNADKTRYICLNEDGRVEFSGFLLRNGKYRVAKNRLVVEANEVYSFEREGGVLFLEGERFERTESVCVTYHDGDFSLQSLYPKNAVISPLFVESTGSKKFEGWRKKGQKTVYDFSEPLTQDTEFYATYEMRYLDVEDYAQYYGFYYSETEKTMLELKADNVVNSTKRGVETVGSYVLYTDGTIEVVLSGNTRNGTLLRDGLVLGGREYKKLGDYTLTFENGSASTSQLVKAGEKVTLPNVPSREGYTFQGWYTADGEKFDGNSIVFRSETLIAKWSKATETDVFGEIVLPVAIGVESLLVAVLGVFVVLKFVKKSGKR